MFTITKEQLEDIGFRQKEYRNWLYIPLWEDDNPYELQYIWNRLILEHMLEYDNELDLNIQSIDDIKTLIRILTPR